MAYTLLLWASVRAAPNWLDRAGNRLSRRLSLLTLLAVPWLVLAAGRLGLRPWFEVTHALVDDPMAHAQYLPAFVAGAILARTPGAWPAVARLRLPALLVMPTAWLLLLSLPDAPIALLRTAYAAQQWAGVMAALSFGWVHLRQPTAWKRQLVHRIFAVYVLHQTLIILRKLGCQPVERLGLDGLAPELADGGEEGVAVLPAVALELGGIPEIAVERSPLARSI